MNTPLVGNFTFKELPSFSLLPNDDMWCTYDDSKNKSLV